MCGGGGLRTVTFAVPTLVDNLVGRSLVTRKYEILHVALETLPPRPVPGLRGVGVVFTVEKTEVVFILRSDRSDTFMLD